MARQQLAACFETPLAIVSKRLQSTWEDVPLLEQRFAVPLRAFEGPGTLDTGKSKFKWTRRW
ncbi:hypothetical protein LINPERHAP2_LOCUS37577 [Linum perenne]